MTHQFLARAGLHVIGIRIRVLQRVAALATTRTRNIHKACRKAYEMFIFCFYVTSSAGFDSLYFYYYSCFTFFEKYNKILISFYMHPVFAHYTTFYLKIGSLGVGGIIVLSFMHLCLFRLPCLALCATLNEKLLHK